MDITAIIVALISAVSAIAVAVIGGVNLHNHNKDKVLQDRRAEELRLAMAMQAANLELSDVIAIAVSGGKTNGNVKEAREKARKAKEAYYNFINSVAAETLTKK